MVTKHSVLKSAATAAQQKTKKWGATPKPPQVEVNHLDIHHQVRVYVQSRGDPDSKGGGSGQPGPRKRRPSRAPDRARGPERRAQREPAQGNGAGGISSPDGRRLATTSRQPPAPPRLGGRHGKRFGKESQHQKPDQSRKDKDQSGQTPARPEPGGTRQTCPSRSRTTPNRAGEKAPDQTGARKEKAKGKRQKTKTKAKAKTNERAHARNAHARAGKEKQKAKSL